MLGPVWASPDDDVELKVRVARLSRRERAWICVTCVNARVSVLRYSGFLCSNDTHTMAWDLFCRPRTTLKTLTACVAIGLLCDGCCLTSPFMRVRTSLTVCYVATVCCGRSSTCGTGRRPAYLLVATDGDISGTCAVLHEKARCHVLLNDTRSHHCWRHLPTIETRTVCVALGSCSCWALSCAPRRYPRSTPGDCLMAAVCVALCLVVPASGPVAFTARRLVATHVTKKRARTASGDIRRLQGGYWSVSYRCG